MNRQEFLRASANASLGCCGFVVLDSLAPAGVTAVDEKPDPEKEFLKNWLADLFDALDVELDAETKTKVMAGTGVGCFRRFEFKRHIAQLGKGSVEKLLAAYSKNFEVWQDGTVVHVRYGAVSKRCYCPAARYHPAKPNDMHCDCTRATHQAIFETALERSVNVRVVESLRRGGTTCHFVAELA